MKTNMLKKSSLLSGVLAAVALTVSISAQANSIVGGAITMNLNANTLASFNGGSNTAGSRYIYVDEYFDSSYSNQIITGTAPTAVDSIAADSSAMQADINGSSVTAVPGRSHKPTTLNFDGTFNDGTATGQIGTSGAIRISSDTVPGLAGNYLLWDDLGIDYSTGGGWGMFTEDGFFGKNYVFDLTNITEVLNGNSLLVTGDINLTTQASAENPGNGAFAK